MTAIYFDLSEQFFSSGLRFKYYGIARTVMEVGYQLAMADADVRFVVFSPAHERFFEVTPRLDTASPTGVMDPGLPPEATPTRIRHTFPKPNMLRDALYPLVAGMIRRKNLRRWARVPEGVVREVDLRGQTLVSFARPKIMADYLMAVQRDKIDLQFYPLLHDMIPLHAFGTNNRKLFSSNFVHDNHVVIKSAHKILANSDFTKREIEDFAASGHLPPVPEVLTVPLCHELRETGDAVVQLPPTDKPYMFCLGILTGRKNLECVLEAMLHLQQTGRAVPDLVLAGAWRKRTKAYVEQPRFAPVRAQIHFVLNPNQAELRQLYQRALALVIPSRMEGWGLPLGEALWLGTPGLAADTAALHEVGGTLAQYFDPDAPEELAALVDALQSDPDAYAALKARITDAHDSLRTWKDVALGVLGAVAQTRS